MIQCEKILNIQSSLLNIARESINLYINLQVLPSQANANIDVDTAIQGFKAAQDQSYDNFQKLDVLLSYSTSILAASTNHYSTNIVKCYTHLRYVINTYQIVNLLDQDWEIMYSMTIGSYIIYNIFYQRS